MLRLLIDHAWGLEPCGMKEINAYRPETNSLSEGQVLSCPYPYDKARIIVQEMTDSLVFQLTDKGLVTDSLTLDIGYDRENCDKAIYQRSCPHRSLRPHCSEGCPRQYTTGRPDQSQQPTDGSYHGTVRPHCQQNI